VLKALLDRLRRKADPRRAAARPGGGQALARRGRSLDAFG